MQPLSPYFHTLESLPTWRWSGRVVKAVGQIVESDGPPCSVGEVCAILGADGRGVEGQVVGFRKSTVLSMPLRALQGIRFGDRLVTWGAKPAMPVGDALLGRVTDGSGLAFDELGEILTDATRPYDAEPPSPMDRVLIEQPLGSGIRAIDGLLTCGRGQRLGIFGGSGVGKSTLIGMMTRNTMADLTVLALVGERGREVREFLQDALGDEGRKRSVVVVSTSDQSPLLRIRAALAATAIAEHFAHRGRHVLLVVDSLTRFAMAQREIGLAAGEPPTAKGYTPSVFALLARLVERAGQFRDGSITAFYTVLMEGDDQQDPLVDAVRSLLDGHIILDRQLGSQGHYPAIHLLDSLSRLMPAVTSPEHRRQAGRLRQLLAAYRRSEDLVRIGAYQAGADPLLDQALKALPVIQSYLRQGSSEKLDFAASVQQLLELPLGESA
ncbi:MAG: FliI/YscN family ATPase [Acidobacteria bacterium]|nr:MAG: FliI/YscN family ATPase [Acidobacteriota bacterium]